MIELQREDLRFKARIEITIDKVRTLFHYEGDLYQDPELKGMMDQYQEIIGDGKARVGVTTDFAVKDFGNGISTMVSITLSCNQDQQTLQRGLELAAAMGRHYVKIYAKTAEEEYKQMLAEKGGPNFAR